MAFCSNCGYTLPQGMSCCPQCGSLGMELPDPGVKMRSYANDPGQECRDAICAGEQALNCLKEAMEELRRARNWGYADLLGGGMITSLIKHSKLEDCQRSIDLARRMLKVFSYQLEQSGQMADIDIQVEGFLGFADVFLDNPIVDALVQNKVISAMEQVQDTIEKVEQMMSMLRA